MSGVDPGVAGDDGIARVIVATTAACEGESLGPETGEGVGIAKLGLVRDRSEGGGGAANVVQTSPMSIVCPVRTPVVAAMMAKRRLK